MLPRIHHPSLCAASLAALLAACTGAPIGGGDGGTSDPTPDLAAAPDLAPTAAKFSFFVTSLKAMRKHSGSQDGFGGDLRFGETGPGAGLRGADKLCATIAEESLPGSGGKGWRAFLSVTDDGSGKPVHAADRVGEGPFYDRLGRLVAPTKAQLLLDRPQGGDAVIRNDLPNEEGIPNQFIDGMRVDNHDTLTGSDHQGRLYGAGATCLDWTSKQGEKTIDGTPRLGHSWPKGNQPHDGDGWMSVHEAAGCAPGVMIVDTGGGAPPGSNSVGAGGGYGGIYCVALTP